MVFLLGALWGTKAISPKVYMVLLLLRTQPTQHRVCTKAPKLRGSGENNAISLQLYSVLLLPKTQPTQDKLSTKALKRQGSGPISHFTVV